MILISKEINNKYWQVVAVRFAFSLYYSVLCISDVMSFPVRTFFLHYDNVLLCLVLSLSVNRKELPR